MHVSWSHCGGSRGEADCAAHIDNRVARRTVARRPDLAGVPGPPPPTERGLAVFSFVVWLIPLWGIWIDRHREPVVA
jgi:hypothetical protein